MKALVIYAHPVEGSLTSRARDRVIAALRRGGHEVRLTDLYAEGFRPELSDWERVHHLDPLDTKPDIQRHADDLRWCDTIVFVHPTWWGGQPAMLKGWIDRVWVAGLAYELRPGTNRIRALLTNVRRLVVVTTHGSSKLVNTLQGEPGKRTVTRSLRVLCHRLARTRWIALYGVDRIGADDIERFLRRVDRRISRLG